MLTTLFSGTVSAANSISLNAPNAFNNLGNITVSGLVTGFLAILLLAAALVFFFMLVIGGIKWILSGGDKAQAESARNQITAALIGLVIVFAAWAIAQLIGVFFGVNIFGNLSLPTVTS